MSNVVYLEDHVKKIGYVRRSSCQLFPGDVYDFERAKNKLVKHPDVLKGVNLEKLEEKVYHLIHEGLDIDFMKEDYDILFYDSNVLLNMDELNLRGLIGLSLYYLSKRNFVQSKDYISQALDQNPNDIQAISAYFEIYRESNYGNSISVSDYIEFISYSSRIENELLDAVRKNDAFPDLSVAVTGLLSILSGISINEKSYKRILDLALQVFPEDFEHYSEFC